MSSLSSAVLTFVVANKTLSGRALLTTSVVTSDGGGESGWPWVLETDVCGDPDEDEAGGVGDMGGEEDLGVIVFLRTWNEKNTHMLCPLASVRVLNSSAFDG